MTITAPAASSAALARYAFRRSILEPEKTYSLYPDRLQVEVDGALVKSYPLDRIDTVHLRFDRTRQRSYYQCFIHTPGDKVSLRHVHFAGIASFDDRRATYTPFVRALLAALADRPGVRFKAGSMANFIGALIGIPLFVVGAWLAFTLDRVGTGLFAVLMLLLCVSVVRRSRPRGFDPRTPPAELLPE